MDDEAPDYAGMTLNERLWAAGLIDEWEAVVAARDRDGMLAILHRVAVADPSFTIDTILANPERYGFAVRGNETPGQKTPRRRVLCRLAAWLRRKP